MHSFLEILRFELRYQLKSPFFWGVLIVFPLIHFLTVATHTIDIGDMSELINVNSPYRTIYTEAALAYFGMLPTIVFMVTAITRDHEKNMAEFFFVAPVSKHQFLLGRFCGGFLLALLVAVAGLLGGVLAVFMPWLDPARLSPFSMSTYGYSFFVVVLPYTFIVCSFFFAVAALTRSVAMTFVLALLFMLLNFILFIYSAMNTSDWIGLLDLTGVLAITTETRFWTISELNTVLPMGLLLGNRLIWIGLTVLVLICTCLRFRFDLSAGRNSHFQLLRLRKDNKATSFVPSISDVTVSSNFSFKGQVVQFKSQLFMDIYSILQSPFFYAVLFFSVFGTIGDHQRHVSPALNIPLIPVTSLMFDFFRFGLISNVMLIVIYFSGDLIHRERESGVNEIIDATPYSNWTMPLSKMVTLWAIISIFLGTSMLTSISLQALAGYSNFELGLYFKGLFVFNGFYFYMLSVLAILVQTLSPNKWLGMFLLFCVYVFLFSMELLGMENILYGFRIPYAIYSDMNGFGPYSKPVLALIAYWGMFCVLLIALVCSFFPRGYYTNARERWVDARSRFSPQLQGVSVFATACFISIGGWIYYNTSVLNQYQTTNTALQLQADYEFKYGEYQNRPAPTFQNITMEIDLYPEEKRVESRGSAVLSNNKPYPISEFVISVNPKMQIVDLKVESATASVADSELGFYLYNFTSPLNPGDTATVSWDMSRPNAGFVNANPDVEVVNNGTFIESRDIMPIPGYEMSRELSDSFLRGQFGLPSMDRLPELGDPMYLDILGAGIGSRANISVIFSTSADQIAVAPGVLQRQWRDGQRRYFEYVTEHPILQGLSFTSARYEVARDNWNDVQLEIYHDAKHSYNSAAMLGTAKKSLDYFTREFSPYQHSYFRILEYPRYRNAARAFAGTIPYSESVGFVTDMAAMENMDFATMHELAHQWWGAQAYGAYMQGRQLLNEGLASYSALMVSKEYLDPVWLRRMLAETQSGYLAGRGRETREEQPLMTTEDQGYISYNKGALAMFALQDIIGTDKIHEALRNYLDKFAFQPPPFPTSQDLVNELRAVSGEEYQDLITDLFEKIVLYDVQVDSAEAVPADGGYELAIEFTTRQFEATGLGEETEVLLHTYFDVAIFPESDQELFAQTPIYLKKHLLQSGTHTISIHVEEKPGTVGIDPFHVMIDRIPGNNVLNVSMSAEE